MTGFRSFATACVLGLLVAGSPSGAESQERGGGGRGGGLGAGQGAANPDLLRLNGALQVLVDARNRVTDPLAGPVVAGAPFSADATTTVTQTLGDGTRIEQRTTTKLFRDNAGRMRREQTVIGLDRLSPSTEPQTTITFDSVPGDQRPFMLDPVNRTAMRVSRGISWSSGTGAWYTPATIRVNNADGRRFVRTDANPALQPAAIPSDVKPIDEQLGTRSFDGVKATGKRTTTIIPTDRIGNDKPISITNEEWQSPELGLTVYSRFSDPRTGVVEYRLNNVNRSEPRADLFAVPSDYTVIENTPGLRTGRAGERGGGGRGARGN